MKKTVFLVLIMILGIFIITGCSIFKPPPKQRKPVVYVYNPTNDTISITLDYHGVLTNVYPKMDNTWNITADENGKLMDLADGREYAYLYYEGLPDRYTAEQDKGFVIQRDSVIGFLQDQLDVIGFNYRESNDMISYWLPQLTEKEYVLISFLFNDECDIYSELKISPKPDAEIRLMMEFISLDQYMEVAPQEIPSFERKPYTVVEWGGINFTSYKSL